MPDSPFRSALLSKNRQACKEALSQDLRGTELVECLNDLLYCSVSVIQTSIQEMHPVCVINSIKNLIGDDRENPSKPLLQFAANYLLGFKFRNDDESILLASNIASEIEAKVKYPGEIKVSVIRELRTTQYAR